MMYEAIKNFPAQFAYNPIVENADKIKQYDGFIVAGMGGSHLAGDLLRAWRQELDIIIHSDYGLPVGLKSEWLPHMLFIASSYSGNTEETLDAYEEAGKRGMARAAIAVGGQLLERAKKDGVPYIQLSDTGIQPRSALGFSLKALLKIIGAEDALAQASGLVQALRSADYEAQGRELAQKLQGRVPVIYASSRNRAIAYNWKIKFNETGKIPAFYNIFPELNHNEMTGFDVQDTTRPLSQQSLFIFLRDDADDPRIAKRMAITEWLYRNRGLAVAVMTMRGASMLEKIFSSLLVADWTAYYTAENYGLESEQVPMVEEFKKLMAS